MEKRRGRSRRKNQLTLGSERDKYYSALGGDTSFLNDVPPIRCSDRIWFHEPESVILDDLSQKTEHVTDFHENESLDSEAEFYTLKPENRESSRSERCRKDMSKKVQNIFEFLEDWDIREIRTAYQGLSKLEFQVLEASWTGQIDLLHEALLKAKEIRKVVNNASVIVNCHDSKGRTPLHFASAFGHSQVVQFLIQNGALVNIWDRSNRVTPLTCACACGSLAVVEILIAHNADVNAGHGRYMTPLHLSVRTGSEDCVKKLLGAGANQNSFNVDVGTPVHLAAAYSNDKCLKILLENGAACNISKGVELWTALHIAVNEGSSECAELLIEAGADIEAKDSREQTPLHIATTNGDSELTSVLLAHKANVGVRDCDGRTPLHKAVSRGNESAECLLLLLEHAAKIDSQDSYGYTALHLAAINDSSFSASYLLQQGADVTMRTKTGQSVLSLLVKKMPHVIRHIRESLDGAVTINNVDPTDPECELKLDFRPMIANPSKAQTNSQRSKTEQSATTANLEKQSHDDMQRETEFLTCLIKTGYKSYLSHPLIESFIVLKWQRVRLFFWISLIFYGIMVMLYSIYVYEVYVNKCPFKNIMFENVEGLISNKSDPWSVTLPSQPPEFKCIPDVTQFNTSRSRYHPNSGIFLGPIPCKLTEYIWLKVIWFLLCFICVVITVKEIFQMIQGFRVYFMALESYFQWLLLGTIFMAIWPVPMTGICLDYWHYPSAATGILVAWSLMLVRIGRFPALGIYVQMLAKVIQNFGLFISAYICLIIAFALTFTIVFPDEPSFSSIPRSLLKTVTMMVGELNYDDLFYQKVIINGTEETRVKDLYYPITTHILFSGFVIFITIIMMNLLVGLAVHDIQSLEKGAKLDRLLRQTSSISGLESFLFSKGLHALLPNSFGSFLRKRALLVPSSYKWTFYFRPNDPRDTRLPKELIREALCLANTRQLKKRPSQKSKRATVGFQSMVLRWETHFDNMEKRITENTKKDLETILAQIKEITNCSSAGKVLKNM